MKNERLDTIMSSRGLVESRSLAQRLIMAGQVRVGGEMMIKPSAKISLEAIIEIDLGPKFVSRGGDKLEAALRAFKLIDLSEMKCADVGASTGGFTDCLLQYGAKIVYGIDVGYGVLHWKLRNNPNVVVMERTNARYVKDLPTPIDLVTIDASFISLKNLLPNIRGWFGNNGGKVVALIKPQFEAGKAEAAKGEGVIRDIGIHRLIVKDVIQFSIKEGYKIEGLIKSPLIGPKGNKEFLILLTY